ncbi:zinc finger 664-like [Solea senegalensis]|uniref:Zinc finger 664-like n=1 Tax=Solea senegalensis TaxID=28829 RepID=A0AAV6QKV8_SOLSE|nr:zinc finger protein 664-like [Solea senegalensis]KAG7490722.1 zinc finger 664-like [Solea senegalensis]
MSSVLCFRKFVNERLTAAAEEILGVFEKTIVVYEEEIDRQRRLLDVVLKRHDKDIPHSSTTNEEILLNQQKLYDQRRSTTLNQVDPQVLGQLCSGQEKDHFILPQETDMFKLRHAREGSDFSADQNLLMGRDQIRNVPEKESLTSIPVMADSLASGAPAPYPDHHFSHNSYTAHSQDHGSGNHETAGTHHTPENKPFKCMVCSEEFHDFLKLKMHIRSHTGEKHLKRKGKAFTQKALGMNHTVVKPFICRVCGKEFSCQSSLISHMKSHSGERPYQCITCGKTFSRGADLRRHTRTHTGEKPYSCIYCNKEFSYHSSLTNHVRVHTGEKPYKCMWCGKRFALSTTLKIHTRVHTGEKPYTCDFCEKSFAHNTGLRLHRRVHAGENHLVP